MVHNKFDTFYEKKIFIYIIIYKLK